MEIEVEWEARPKSGITQIDIENLNCYTIEEWNALDKQEQKKRINGALVKYDGGSLRCEAVDWD